MTKCGTAPLGTGVRAALNRTEQAQQNGASERLELDNNKYGRQ
jgi:hypothetical protein